MIRAAGRTAFPQLRKHAVFYLMLLPAAVYFVVFQYVPIWGARLAFQDFRFVGASPWVGLRHFSTLLSSTAFGQVLRNTVVISAMKIFINFPMPVLLALMLCEVPSGGLRKAVQSVIYLPHFLSWVVIAGIFVNLLALQDGAVNRLLAVFGAGPVPFLTRGRSMRWIFVFSEMWRSVGWDSLVYVAVILRIDPDLFEAAHIDGAGTLRRIVHITIPSILPTVVTVFILNLGFFMNAGFDQVFNLMNDAVVSQVDIIDTYVYRIGLLGGEFSYATAAGLFKGAIGMVLILGTHVASRRATGKGLW